MRIAVVLPELFPVPPLRGGAVEGLAHELTLRLTGHDVHVFGIADPELPREQTTGHLRYWRFAPTPWDRALLSTYKLPFKRSDSIRYWRPYSAWVAKHLRRIQPDVVHVWARMPFVHWLRQAAPCAGLIQSVHQVSGLRGPAVWSPERAAECDLVTVCSRFLADEMTRRYPYMAAQTRIVPNGIDTERFTPWWGRLPDRAAIRSELGLGSGPVVLYAGRLVEQKGVHVLAEAFERLAATHRSAQLLLVGSHTYSDNSQTLYVQALRNRLEPLGSRVRWTGFVRPDRLPKIYAAADVAVVPSVGPEAFSMIIVEAMASGLPCVSFDHGGPSELVVEGRTGRLVPLEQGAEGLVRALSPLLADATLRRQLGEAGRARTTELFDWTLVSRRAEALYREAAELGLSRGRPAGVPVSGHEPVRPSVLIAESGTGYGGTGKYLVDLAGQLNRERFQVHVVAAQDGPFIRQLRDFGLPLDIKRRWRFPWVTFRPSRSPLMRVAQHAVALAVSFVQVLVMAPAMAFWLKRRRISLVHLNNEILSHVPLILGARLAGCRLVCHLHGWRPFTRLEHWASRSVDRLICISRAGATYHSEQLGWRPVEAIANGLDINGHVVGLPLKRSRQRERWGVPANSRVMAIVGRLVPWKGHEVYLRALAAVIREEPHVVGVIVGHDSASGQPHLTRLKALADTLGISAYVRFWPWQEDVWSVYAGADVLVHASVTPEPFGLVLLEAMAAGLPVIASSAGGVVDIVRHDETGLLVPPGDAPALAAAMRRLIRDPELAGRLTAAAAVRVRQDFSIDRNVRQVEAVYDGLLASGRVTAGRPS